MIFSSVIHTCAVRKTHYGKLVPRVDELSPASGINGASSQGWVHYGFMSLL